MKTACLLVLLLGCFAAAQDSTQATVYFYRDGGMFGKAVRVDVFVDQEHICMLHSDHYCVVQLAAGEHSILADREVGATNDGYQVSFEAGKSYYFKVLSQKKSMFTLSGMVGPAWKFSEDPDGARKIGKKKESGQK